MDCGLLLTYLPNEIIENDINVPTAPNNVMVMKFLKNCFFLTWNLLQAV